MLLYISGMERELIWNKRTTARTSLLVCKRVQILSGPSFGLDGTV